MTKFIVLLIFLIPAVPLAVCCQPADPPPASLQQLVTALYAQGKLHGGILVGEEGEVVFQQAWGIANHDNSKLLTPSQSFYLNSLGKMFTSILIMQMVEDGILSLNDKLSELYPDFTHPRAREITVHQLLSHRSGIKDYAMAMIMGDIPGNTEGKERLEAMAGMPLDFEPGTRFNYSNTGYYLLGLIIEKYRRALYGEVLRERIFDPLGMQDTSHDPLARPENLPVYFMQDGTTEWEFESTTLEPGDGGVSTMQDLHTFLLALGSEELLTRESWELIFTPHSLPSEKLENAWPPPHQHPYGYGFSLMELPFEGNKTARAVGHGGAGLGSNFVVRYLDSKRIVVVWNNIFKNPVLPEVFAFLAGR